MPDFATYIETCSKRWFGPAMDDACANWEIFEEIREELTAAMLTFLTNPTMEDLNRKHHNPDGTLTAFLWRLQEAIQPDKSCLHPLLDFEDTHQKTFLRRGLIAYCQQLIREIQTPSETHPSTPCLPLLESSPQKSR